jgi:hypothetical protein
VTALARSLVFLFATGLVLHCQGLPGLDAVATFDYEFCEGRLKGIGFETIPPRAITMQFDVRVVYVNRNNVPVILPLDPSATLVVSRSANETGEGKRQILIPPVYKRPVMDLRDFPIDLSLPDWRRFEILPPQQASPHARSIFGIHLQVHDPDQPSSRLELLGKKVLLQLELDHQRIPPDLSRDLQVRWSKQGKLWTGITRTVPIGITIPDKPITHKCQSKVRID